MLNNILALEKEFDDVLSNEQLYKTVSPETLLLVADKWANAIWKAAEETGEITFTEKEIQAALQFSKKGVFICGVHRSGTTLLRDLLDGHPLLSVLPSEGSYITNLERILNALPADMRCGFLCKEWLRRLVNPINQPPFWLLGRSSQKESSYVVFARAFISWWSFFSKSAHEKNNLWPLLVVQFAYAFARNNQAYSTFHFWVDKTPANERYLTRLWQQFPEAKIIHIIRNPVHVLASRKKIEHINPVRIFIRDLKMSLKIAVIQQAKNDNRYLLIRYEDICSNPTAAAEGLASFLGIQPLPCLTHPTVAGKPALSNSSFIINTAFGKILNAAEHQQKNILNKKELELLSASVGDSAIQLGYTLPRVNVAKAFLLRIINRVW